MSCVWVVAFLLISLGEPTPTLLPKVWRTLQSLSVLSEDLLRSHYLPRSDDSPTTWTDDACPTILVHGNLFVAGSLLVKGRIQVLASANLSSFESTDSALVVKTHRISKFLLTRCSREPQPCETSVNDCPFRGDLVLPGSSLIVAGGSLTVLGSIAADGLFVDNAAEVSVGGMGVLGPQRVKSLLHETPHADPLCEGGVGQPALLIPRGMLYLKNAARLWSFGKIVASVVGLDRASFWMARCGELETKGPEGAGDMALLASSKFVKTGGGRVDLAQLVVSETSDFLMLGGSLTVGRILKVSLRSKLELWAGRLAAQNLFLSDSAEVLLKPPKETGALDVTKGMFLMDSSVLQVHCSRLGRGGACVRVDTLEVYDYSQVVVLATDTLVSLACSGAMTLDGGVWLKVAGSVVVDGTLFMSNMSRVEVGSDLTVQGDAIAKNGVSVSVKGDLNVACSLWLEQRSKVSLGQSLRVRTTTGEDFEAVCGEGNQSPVLFMTNSEIAAGQRVLLGNRKSVERLMAILRRSSISARHFAMTTTQEDEKKVLLLRKMSTMHIFGDGTRPRDYHFLGGTYCSLESGSGLHLSNLGSVKLGTLDVVDRSTLASNNSESVGVEFLGLQMNSRADFTADSSVTFTRAIEVEGNSQLRVLCKAHIQLGNHQPSSDRPQPSSFDHLLVSTGSYLEMGIAAGPPRASAKTALHLEGMWVAQDRSIIVFNIATNPSSNSFDLNVETNSAVFFNVPLVKLLGKNQISKTLDSQVILHQEKLATDTIRIYSLMVPPSNAADLVSFFRTSPLRSKSKNSFWNRNEQQQTLNETV